MQLLKLAVNENFNSQNLPAEDEVLQQIKNCLQELATVNAHNVSELNRLRKIVATDEKRQAVKNALENVDRHIVDMYTRHLEAKQKMAQQQDENGLVLKQKPQLDLAEAESIIKQQVKLNQLHISLTEQTDYSLLR